MNNVSKFLAHSQWGGVSAIAGVFALMLTAVQSDPVEVSVLMECKSEVPIASSVAVDTQYPAYDLVTEVCEPAGDIIEEFNEFVREQGLDINHEIRG